MQRALTLCFAVAVSGCGGDWSTVEGQVRLDGMPLEKGQITFVPVTTGVSAYGTTDSRGNYSLRTGDRVGLKSGDYVVTISAMTIPKEGTKETAKLLTPAKYATKDRSGLKVTVKSGGNSFPFDLSSK